MVLAGHAWLLLDVLLCWYLTLADWMLTLCLSRLLAILGLGGRLLLAKLWLVARKSWRLLNGECLSSREVGRLARLLGIHLKLAVTSRLVLKQHLTLWVTSLWLAELCWLLTSELLLALRCLLTSLSRSLTYIEHWHTLHNKHDVYKSINKCNYKFEPF